jgi:hypothetical protein
LNPCILGDYVSHAQRHQTDRAAVVPLFQEWNRFSSEPADFAIGKNRLEAVTNFDAILVVLHCQQN